MPSLKNKNVLVTGGAGFIGSHLVDRIIREKPKSLIVLDNFFLGKMRNLEDAKLSFPKLKIYKTSLTNYKKTKDIIVRNKIDVVFNLAVIPLPTSLVKPEWTFKDNVTMVLNICRLAKEGEFKTLIHFSSSEAYGTAQKIPMSETHPLNPETTYAASKAAGDQLVMAYHNCFGIDCAIVRPFNNYGPRQNEKAYAGIIPLTVRRAVTRKPQVIHGDGLQTRDFIYVGDTADAVIQVYNHSNTRGLTLNIAGGKEVKIIHLVREMMKYLNDKSTIKFTAPRQGDVLRHLADVSLAKKLINFKPKTNLDSGLRETISWYMKNGEF